MPKKKPGRPRKGETPEEAAVRRGWVPPDGAPPETGKPKAKPAKQKAAKRKAKAKAKAKGPRPDSPRRP
ncbi:hypothetical protein [Nannocystis pusilla]|uniref:hypothetical protein n=1 Tax=Nannocystis pusilla TaxID=889268 RepID=UPI003B776CE9